MRITPFFRDTLGANLKNSRWSWGAFDQASKRVFLRVWEDEIQLSDGRELVLVYRKNPVVHSAGDTERLDPMNGLPLVASLDALFDAGLLSFEDSGRMLVSSELPQREREIHGLVGKGLTRTPPTETAAYLRYHRSRLFRK